MALAELQLWISGGQTLAFSGCWLTGRRSLGSLNALQEGNLKGRGEGHPHVLKDEPKTNKTILAEQRSLVGTQENKRVYELWKKEQATQEDYKDVMRLCREKIRRSKTQLELNLACAVKDNKNASKSVMKHWNKLPRKVVESPPLEVFERCTGAVLWNTV